MRRGYFLGIAVGAYRYDPGDRLDRAVDDVEFLARYLSRSFDITSLRNPTAPDVQSTMRRLEKAMADGGALVFVWSGHGIAHDLGGLRMLTTEADPAWAMPGVRIDEIAAGCAATGASQLLLIIDTCFAGNGLAHADRATASILDAQPPDADDVWVGVLAAAGFDQVAYDGELAGQLRRLIEHGPTDPKLRVQWSAHNELIPGDTFIQALLKEWDPSRQRPRFRQLGSPERMLPNPLHNPHARSEIVAHLLKAARAGEAADQRSWFTGRRTELATIVDWVKAGGPGLRVVTGSPGTGKTALLGRIVSLSNSAERARLLRRSRPAQRHDPGAGSIHAHVHARRLSADGIAAVIDDHLSAAGWWSISQDGARNVHELIGIARKRADLWSRCPVLVVDGLDEARGEAFDIARSLLVPMSKYTNIIVSTRQLREESTGASIPRILDPAARLDLDAPDLRQSTVRDINRYVRRRLARVHEHMDPRAVADVFTARSTVTASTGQTVDRPFLLARLVTEQLRSQPVDTRVANWQREISSTIELAFDADLNRALGDTPDDQARLTRALAMMTALTWAGGSGFPEEEWLLVAGEGAGREDVPWILDTLGRYLVQDGESGQAVYRIFHQTLADYLRKPFRPKGRTPFDPAATAVTKALMGRLGRLASRGTLARSSPYLTKYAALHAELAGPQGIRLLVSAAGPDPALRDQVIAAAEAVATTCLEFDRPVLLAELRATLSGVAVTPELAERLAGPSRPATTREPYSPPTQPELAVASPDIVSWGHHNAVVEGSPFGPPRSGAPDVDYPIDRLRRELAPAVAEAIALGVTRPRLADRARVLDGVVALRRVAARDRTLEPALALALGALANVHRVAGRFDEEVAALEEATSLYRSLASIDVRYLVDVANTLSSLGAAYSRTGRPELALAPSEEAVTILRDQLGGRPKLIAGLAWALNNLGIRRSEVGSLADALAANEEAVSLYRRLASDDPAYLREFASALTNLGVRMSDSGRSVDALVVSDEAVRIYRDLSATNEQYVPDLASALNNLGNRLGDTADYVGAFKTTEEAVRLYRGLVTNRPEFLSDLAGALDNFGNRLSAVGRAGDAIPVLEEALANYRRLSRDNPAFLLDLATTLNNLGITYKQIGRHEEALTYHTEAANVWRNLAADNRANQTSLAKALNNLSIALGRAGRHEDAMQSSREALEIWRHLSELDPAAYAGGLAKALNNLSNRLIDLGQFEHARSVVLQAAERYRLLAADNPAFLPDLAKSLTNVGELERRLGRLDDAVAAYRQAVDIYLSLDLRIFVTDLCPALAGLADAHRKRGDPEAAERAWTDVLAHVTSTERASILWYRIQLETTDHAAPAAWIADALGHASEAPRLTVALHDSARSHYQADPVGFEAEWRRVTGQDLPAWCTVDSDSIEHVREWLRTPTKSAKRKYMIAHPEILNPAVDPAVEEALLLFSTAENAQRYWRIREVAREHGIDAAYQSTEGDAHADE